MKLPKYDPVTVRILLIGGFAMLLILVIIILTWAYVIDY